VGEQRYPLIARSEPFWAETICVKCDSFAQLSILNQCVSPEHPGCVNWCSVHACTLRFCRFSGSRKTCFPYRKTAFPLVPEQSNTKRTCGHNGPYCNYNRPVLRPTTPETAQTLNGIPSQHLVLILYCAEHSLLLTCYFLVLNF
jgi:hypothetical protein